MKWTGRQLKDLGCPQNKIKFFVDKDFDSEESLMDAIRDFRQNSPKTEEEKEREKIISSNPNCAFRFLWELGEDLPCLPRSLQSSDGKMSKRELRQLLDQGSVRINGEFPKPHDIVNFPINDLVFYPGAKRQTTLA